MEIIHEVVLEFGQRRFMFLARLDQFRYLSSDFVQMSQVSFRFASRVGISQPMNGSRVTVFHAAYPNNRQTNGRWSPSNAIYLIC